MKQKAIYLVMVGIAVAFTTFNIYTIQIKNSKSLAAYSALLLTQPFNALAQDEYKPADYLPDPCEGSGRGAAVREVEHSETLIIISHKLIYSYPTTTVNCYGEGDIPCSSGFYLGKGTLVDIVVDK